MVIDPPTVDFDDISGLKHCNENPIYVFIFWELRGLSPNCHIHVPCERFIYSQDLSTIHIFFAEE